MICKNIESAALNMIGSFVGVILFLIIAPLMFKVYEKYMVYIIKK